MNRARIRGSRIPTRYLCYISRDSFQMCRREVIFGWHPARGAEIGLLDENLASENQGVQGQIDNIWPLLVCVSSVFGDTRKSLAKRWGSHGAVNGRQAFISVNARVSNPLGPVPDQIRSYDYADGAHVVRTSYRSIERRKKRNGVTPEELPADERTSSFPRSTLSKSARIIGKISTCL